MPLRDTELGELLDTLGARSPTPGGGAACAVVAAVGAALSRMVVNYSVGKKTLADHEPLHREALETLLGLEQTALRLAEEDQAAYARLNTLWRLPEGDAERESHMQAALRDAIDVPMRSLEAALDILRLLERLTGTTNRQLGSDLAIAAVFAHAAADAAAWNVRINLPGLDAPDDVVGLERQVAERLSNAQAIRLTVEAACQPG